MEVLYLLCRPVLAVLCLLLFRKLRFWYFAVSAVALIIPANLYSAAYWRVIWTPIEIVRLGLAIMLSLQLFDVTTTMLRDRERHAVIGFGMSAGIAICLVAWLWQPENWFQGFASIRQYAYLSMACGFLCTWVWLRWIRPVPVAFIYGSWALWLIWAVLMSSTGKGGLLWTVTPWHGGSNAYYAASIVGMIGQGLIAVSCLKSLHPRQATA